MVIYAVLHCRFLGLVYRAGFGRANTLDTGGGLMIVLNKCSALVMRGAAIYFGAVLLSKKKGNAE